MRYAGLRTSRMAFADESRAQSSCGGPILSPLAGHHRIDIVAPTTRTDQPLAPIGNGCLGALPSRHFGWRRHLRWLGQELRRGIGTFATFRRHEVTAGGATEGGCEA